MKITAIIPASGSGSRYDKKKNKLLENIGEIPVIIHTLRAVSSVEMIDDIIICASGELFDKITNLISEYKIPKIQKVILGGKTRQESVFNGIKSINNKVDFVLIHDGARPFIQKKTVESVIKLALDKGAAIVAVPTKDTIKKVDKNSGKIVQTLNRSELWNVQTPQVFKYEDILKAHTEFKGGDFTDDSAIVEKIGISVFVTLGGYENIKITTPEDIQIAQSIIKKL